MPRKPCYYFFLFGVSWLAQQAPIVALLQAASGFTANGLVRGLWHFAVCVCASDCGGGQWSVAQCGLISNAAGWFEERTTGGWCMGCDKREGLVILC